MHASSDGGKDFKVATGSEFPGTLSWSCSFYSYFSWWIISVKLKICRSKEALVNLTHSQEQFKHQLIHHTVVGLCLNRRLNSDWRGRWREDGAESADKNIHRRVKMKRVTCALQDTTALRLHTTHRIHIPAWKRRSGMKMQITKLVSFMSGCEGSERRGEITIIQQDFNPKCSSNATSCSDLGLKREGKGQENTQTPASFHFSLYFS